MNETAPAVSGDEARFTGVAARNKLWKPGRTLRIAFLDGDPDVQERIEEAVQEWTRHANIVFVFGDDQDAEIRISFANAGSWSYVGTDALLIPEDKPTMNFGWLTPTTDDTELSRVVLWQFGHALGLLNAHQSPAADIPWDYEALTQYYSGPPNNWSDAQIEANFFAPSDTSSLLYGPLDPLSIMLPPIPNEFTIGDFETTTNFVLSDADKVSIGVLYPFE